MLFRSISAAALSALFYYLPVLSEVNSGFVIIIVAVAVSLVMAVTAPIKDEENRDTPPDLSENMGGAA